MSFARRLILVGTDHRLTQQLQTHFHKSFLLTVPVIRPEDLVNVVNRDTDGVLLYVASDSADLDKFETAIREYRLQQWPPRIAVLEPEDSCLGKRLDGLQRFVEARFAWPTQHRELNTWIRRAVLPGTPFPDPATETTRDRITRRLLNLTPSLAPLAQQLEIAASHDVTVLIEGQTGTGKTHLAKLIHDCSDRANHRFLVVACGAISSNLIASEFFGHAKGAFTGADATKVGKFAAAGQGTILLDEIDTLGLEQQANLLRVIETGEYEPVGSNETQHCQARIVAATNWNLADAVERGTFRRDLYYRLHVVTFHLPPLRSRPQDLGPLVRGMVAKYATRFGKKLENIQPEVFAAIEQFPWPGNIRQLENVVQQAVLTCSTDSLTLVNLPPMVQARLDEKAVQVLSNGANSLALNRETSERAAILRALEKVGFSRTRAAELLGVSRVTLYKKMKKYGLLFKSGSLTDPPVVTSPSPQPQPQPVC